MSKEQSILEIAVIDKTEVAVQTEVVELNDLSLALIGGGTMVVQF